MVDMGGSQFAILTWRVYVFSVLLLEIFWGGGYAFFSVLRDL